MVKAIQKKIQLALVAARAEAHDHHEHGANCVALCCAHNGQRAFVTGFSGDQHEAGRLRDLGVREGAVVTVLRDGNPLMIRVDNARIGISRAAAMNVLCELC
jgi:Fe2+ transport system protein FeoA